MCLAPPVGLSALRALDREHRVARDAVTLIRPAEETLEDGDVLFACASSRRSPSGFDELLHPLDAHGRSEVGEVEVCEIEHEAIERRLVLGA